MQSITDELVSTEIPPGFRSHGTKEKPEKQIVGSNYITYRYFDELKKRSNWPKDDPVGAIKVTNTAQAKIPLKSLDTQKSAQDSEHKLKFL